RAHQGAPTMQVDAHLEHTDPRAVLLSNCPAARRKSTGSADCVSGRKTCNLQGNGRPGTEALRAVMTSSPRWHLLARRLLPLADRSSICARGLFGVGRLCDRG